MCSPKTKTLLISIIGLVVSLLELVIPLPYLLDLETPISQWMEETHNEHFIPAINGSVTFSNVTEYFVDELFGKITAIASFAKIQFFPNRTPLQMTHVLV